MEEVQNLDPNTRGDEDRWFGKIAKVSQSLQPLPQYGRPGFEAAFVLDVFGEDEIGPDRLPSDKYPSDHLSICADLMLLWGLDLNQVEREKERRLEVKKEGAREKQRK